MEIKRIEQDFTVCQVKDYSLVNLDSEYSFIEKTDEEKSLVCITSEVQKIRFNVMMVGKLFVFREYWIFP